ncbi:MAG: TetR family transcriptional regulator [Burkholderiaceae bacterium]
MSAPQPPRTTTRRFNAKREAIIAAAAWQFNRHGIKGTMLADIAARVGLATTSVTYYYRKKEDLAMECMMRSIAAHHELAEQAAQATDAEQRVRAFMQLHAQMLAAHDNGQAAELIVFDDIRALPQTHLPEAFAAYTNMFRSVRRLLEARPTDTPRAKPDREAMNARANILLSVTTWTRAWIGRYETDEYSRIGDRVADLLLNGLAGVGRPAWPPAAGEEGLLAALPEARNAHAESFLRAATELVNEEGYRGASVEKIASRINLSKGSLYYEHDSKLDLVSACFERSFALLRGALVTAERSAGSGWQRIGMVVDQLVRFQVSDRGPLLRTSAIIALPDEARRESVRRTYERLIERIVEMIVDGMVNCSVRPCNPAIAAQMLASAVNAAAELKRWAPNVTMDKVTALYTRPTLFGLLSSSGEG